MRGGAFVTLCCAALMGCTANDTAIYHKWDVDGEDGGRSVIIDAKQRAIMSVKRPSSKHKGDEIRMFCAEPSPDALSAISSSFATSLSVGIFGQGEGAGALSSALSEAASELGRRNATIQLLRDGYYRLCEAYVNESLSSFQYNLLARKLADQMIILLAIEQLTPSDKEELRITTGGNSRVSVNTSAMGGGTPSTDSTPPANGTTPPEEPPPEEPETPGATEPEAPPEQDSEVVPPPDSETEPPPPPDTSDFNRGIPPSLGPAHDASNLLPVNASTSEGRVLNGVASSDSHYSSLTKSTPNGHTKPAKAAVQIAQAESSSSEESETGAEPPAAPESEEGTGSVLEGGVEVESEADAEAGAPAAATKISQGRATPPSPEVSRAITFIIAKYLNQSRFADCLLALDNLTLLGSESPDAEEAIVNGCTAIFSSVAEASKSPSQVFGYGVLSDTNRGTTSQPGGTGEEKRE